MSGLWEGLWVGMWGSVWFMDEGVRFVSGLCGGSCGGIVGVGFVGVCDMITHSPPLIAHSPHCQQQQPVVGTQGAHGPLEAEPLQ